MNNLHELAANPDTPSLDIEGFVTQTIGHGMEPMVFWGPKMDQGLIKNLDPDGRPVCRALSACLPVPLGRRQTQAATHRQATAQVDAQAGWCVSVIL